MVGSGGGEGARTREVVGVGIWDGLRAGVGPKVGSEAGAGERTGVGAKEVPEGAGAGVVEHTPPLALPDLWSVEVSVGMGSDKGVIGKTPIE